MSFSPWNCTDSDCMQYLRRDGSFFEMIEMYWLDRVKEEEETVPEYVVLRTTIDLDCYDDDEITAYVSSYGYTLDETDAWMRAECILEDELVSDVYVVHESFSRGDAENYIKSVIEKGD